MTENTNLDVWHEGWNPRVEKLNGVRHMQILQDTIKGYEHLKTIDLGCGSEAVSIFFEDYEGVDLPGFDAYTSDFGFISDYDLILMNAFIDVFQHPMQILDKVFKHATGHIILHRQEFTEELTHATKEKAYTGWTWHSKINWDEFVLLMIKHYVYIVKDNNCEFNNWNQGGKSLLLKKIT